MPAARNVSAGSRVVGEHGRVSENPRTRDPARRGRILRAAADLLSHNGFHSVSLADIGTEAGITGSGIYRHFEGKAAILVALFDEAVDDLLAQERDILDAGHDLGRALELLVAGQVDFVVDRRQLAQVYYTEIRNLPEADRIRLRRKQRLYVEEWVHVLAELRPELDDASRRVVVHASIGAIQSALFHNSGLPEDRLRSGLNAAAWAVLGVEPS